MDGTEGQAQGAQQGTEPNGEAPDYKALYEQTLAHSREWEKKAKANKTAADELAKAREAGKTADERIADLTARLDAKERAEARAAMAGRVAAEKGVPVNLITGDDEEAMNASADALIAFRDAAPPKPAPKVDGAGKFPRGKGDEAEADGKRAFVRQLLGKE